MKILIVLGCIAVALWLLTQVRLGGEVEYSADGFFLKLRLGAFRMTVYPFKARTKSPKKKRKHPKAETAPVAKSGGTLALFRQYFPLVCETVGTCRRKLRVDYIRLDLIWGAADPADCAMGYGYANAALGMIWPIFEHQFRIKTQSIHTGIDFDLKKPTVYLAAAFTMTLGQCSSIGIPLLRKVLRIQADQNPVQTTKKKEAEQV